MSNGLKCTNLCKLQTCDNQPQEEEIDTMITEMDLTDSETDDCNGGLVLRSDSHVLQTDHVVLHVLCHCDLMTSSFVHLNCVCNAYVLCLSDKGDHEDTPE